MLLKPLKNQYLYPFTGIDSNLIGRMKIFVFLFFNFIPTDSGDEPNFQVYRWIIPSILACQDRFIRLPTASLCDRNGGITCGNRNMGG